MMEFIVTVLAILFFVAIMLMKKAVKTKKKSFRRKLIQKFKREKPSIWKRVCNFFWELFKRIFYPKKTVWRKIWSIIKKYSTFIIILLYIVSSRLYDMRD